MTRFAMNLYCARTSPPGGHRARYLDSLASSVVGVLAARACGLVSVSSSRWYTRSVPVQLPYDTRASRVFPQKLIISPRIKVVVVEVYPTTINYYIMLYCRIGIMINSTISRPSACRRIRIIVSHHRF